MELLTVADAAALLGIKVPTLYDWLSKSDYGLFRIRGKIVTINYFQGGPAGQGHIRIDSGEVVRLLESMRVFPRPIIARRRSVTRNKYPGISVPLGRPA